MMSQMIAVDWGTSAMRVYRLESDGRVLRHLCSDDGILKVRQGDFASALAAQLARLGGLGSAPVLLVSGMITSTDGWVETPYIDCPASPADLAEGLRSLKHETLGQLWFVPGVRQLDPEADIMRGEETQLAGIDGRGELLVILPGTHSKWVQLRDSVICRFKSFMTGDLYSAVLTHTILSKLPQDDGSQGIFLRGVRQGYARGQQGGTLLSEMFQVRVEAVLGLAPKECGRRFLSGLLIGFEIAAGMNCGLTEGVADGKQILVVGEGPLALRYLDALAACGIAARHQPPHSAARGLYRIAKAKALV
jgi:2-dehydro-3-deoxygalactonokinase